MQKFRIKVSQVLRVERRAYVYVEATTAEEAAEIQSESDAPPNGPDWETTDYSIENESCTPEEYT